MKCLKNGKVCGNTKKCKDCKLDDCRKTLEVLEDMKKKKEDLRLKSIKKQLADSCKNCSMLQILDIDKQKLYCPYLVRRECLIGSTIKESYLNNMVDKFIENMKKGGKKNEGKSN